MGKQLTSEQAENRLELRWRAQLSLARDGDANQVQRMLRRFVSKFSRPDPNATFGTADIEAAAFVASLVSRVANGEDAGKVFAKGRARFLASDFEHLEDLEFIAGLDSAEDRAHFVAHTGDQLPTTDSGGRVNPRTLERYVKEQIPEMHATEHERMLKLAALEISCRRRNEHLSWHEAARAVASDYGFDPETLKRAFASAMNAHFPE
jgi:hypothetical protein